LSSIAAAVTVSIFMVLLHQPLPYILFGVIAGLYVIWRHSSNVERILAGTEPKLGQKLQLETGESVNSAS
ncbi:MAG: glycerol-3-phosphate 1-O-acyltransferase PlsY, partial [Microcystaceae cyanobacterium]